MCEGYWPEALFTNKFPAVRACPESISGVHVFPENLGKRFKKSLGVSKIQTKIKLINTNDSSF